MGAAVAQRHHQHFRPGGPVLDDRGVRHVVFGEAIAILAGDALLTHGLGVMARHPEEEIYDAAKIKTTSNDGAWTDKLGVKLSGGATRTYKVCEVGSTTQCSDPFVATFP